MYQNDVTTVTTARPYLTGADSMNVWGKTKVVLAPEDQRFDMIKDYHAQINEVLPVFRNMGVDPQSQTRERLLDFIASPEVMDIMPEVVEVLVREEMEPLAFVEQMLFDQVNVPGLRATPSNQIRVRMMGGPVEIEEIAEGAEYKGGKFDRGGYGGGFTCEIKKYGAMFGMTMEAQEEDMFGLFPLWVRKVGRAFARKREQIAVSTLANMGLTTHQNLPGRKSVFGVSTGRGIDGRANGSVTIEDINNVYMYASSRGRNIGVALMHPIMLRMLDQNPSTKELLTSATIISAPIPLRQPVNFGNIFRLGGFGPNDPLVPEDPNANNPTATGLLNPGTHPILSQGRAAIGRTAGGDPLSSLIIHSGDTFQQRGSILGKSLVIIATPHVPVYEIERNQYAGHIILMDPSEVGVFFNREAPTLDEWEDKHRDIKYWKTRSRWGVALYGDGHGVFVMRNITIQPSYAFTLTSDVGPLGRIRYDGSEIIHSGDGNVRVLTPSESVFGTMNRLLTGYGRSYAQP